MSLGTDVIIQINVLSGQAEDCVSSASGGKAMRLCSLDILINDFFQMIDKGASFLFEGLN